MARVQFPEDFRDFLKLLNDHEVEYLLIGGYAVGYHGFPRTTLDMDVWVAINPDNATSLRDLRKNKKASGRPKDIVDLENLPDV